MRTYKGEIEQSNLQKVRVEESKWRRFAFNSMKKAKEGLMIVTFSAVMAAGFTNNVYGDENMTGDGNNGVFKQMQRPRNYDTSESGITKVAPTKTAVDSNKIEERIFTRGEVFKGINAHLNAVVGFKKDYSLERFKSLFKDKQLHEVIESNRSNLKEMGLEDENINKIVEIAKGYDLSKKDSINLNHLYKPEDLTIMLLLNFAVTKKEDTDTLDTQKMDVWLHHIKYGENESLIELTEYISISDLSPEEQHKNLRQGFKQPSPKVKTSFTTPPVFSKRVEVIFGGALTGQAISEYVTEGSTPGSYAISTDKNNLKEAKEALQNYIDTTNFAEGEKEKVEEDLRKIKELEEISGKKFSWRAGAGTGISYEIKGFNIGIESSVFGGNLVGDKKAEATASGQIGYAGWFNDIIGGFLVGGYNYDGTNFNTHTASAKGGFNVVLGNPNHILTLGGKYSYTFGTGMSDPRHTWGGIAGYSYKNVFDVTFEPTNTSTSITLGGYLPLTKNFGLFARVSGDVGYNDIYKLNERAGGRYIFETKAGNVVLDLYGETTQTFSPKRGGLQ